jgi:HAD superfamily hydrolase (TIGR01450 family)
VTDSLARRYELIIFDLDGVVYLDTDAVPGAPDAIRSVVDAGTAVVYATNNASRGAEEVAALLQRLGVPARATEVVTSAQAAARKLAEDLPAGARVLVVGSPALWQEVAAVGLTPVADAAQRPDAVVQGYGPGVGWPELAEACVAIRAGARWVATNTDATLPSPRGPLPGNGSLVAALRTASGREPDLVVGKPEAALFEVALASRGARRALVVGDRLDTDIEGAVRAGLDSLLVLTGVSTAADLLRAPVHQRPTHVAIDLSGLSAPDGASRVPPWKNDATQAGGWRVARDGDRLVLAGDGERIDAVRALAAGAWATPGWSGVETEGAPAAAVVRAAFAASAGRPGSPSPTPGPRPTPTRS